ncbi:MAG: YybH family protein [Gemmatirosa sp.]
MRHRMRLASRLTALLFGAITGSACGAQPPAGAAAGAAAAAPLPSVTLPPELDRVLRDYERAWTARDADGLAALFADDGFVLANGAAPRRGRTAIAEGYRGSGGPLALRALSYATADTVGWIIGAFARAPGEPDGGKFVLALRRAAAGQPWRIAADIDNPIRR